MGDYDQGPDGVLVVALGEYSASTMTVTGNAVLGGTLFMTRGDELVEDGVYHDLVTAGARQGTFDHVASGLEFFSPAIYYSATGVSGGFDRNSVTFAERAENANQAEVAAVLETLDPVGSLYRGVLNARLGLAGTALASLSAQPYADAGVALMQQSQSLREAIAHKPGRIHRGLGGNEDRPAEGTGGWVMTQALQGELHGVRHGAHGLFGGIASDNGSWNVGLITGFTDTTVTGRGPASSQANAQTFHVGLEAGAQIGGFELAATSLYSHHIINMNRALSVPGLRPSIEASYSAGTLQLYGEIAHPLAMPDLGILTPFMGLSWVDHRTDGFRDSGGPASLTVAPGRFNDVGLTLGLRAEAPLYSGDGVTIRGNGSVVGHMGLDASAPALRASFDGSGTFTSSGVSGDPHRLTMEVGLDFNFDGGANLGEATPAS